MKSMTEELHIGTNTISHMLHGRAPSVVTIARIADYLDVSVDYLLGRVSSPRARYTPPSISSNILEVYRERDTTLEHLRTVLDILGLTDTEESDISAVDLAKIADYLETTTDKLVGR